MSHYSTVFSLATIGMLFACRQASSLTCQWPLEKGRNANQSRNLTMYHTMEFIRSIVSPTPYLDMANIQVSPSRCQCHAGIPLPVIQQPGDDCVTVYVIAGDRSLLILKVTVPDQCDHTKIRLKDNSLEMRRSREIQKAWLVGTYITSHNICTVSMMTSWYWNAFRITDPLGGISTGHRWIPLTKGH